MKDASNTIDLVHEFHLLFKRPIHWLPNTHNKETNKLRIRLLREEVTELKEALDAQDNVAVLDALTDIQYILDGSYLSLGFGGLKGLAFDLVHESNMRKLDENGQPIIRADGKIIKPKGWQPPNLGILFQE